MIDWTDIALHTVIAALFAGAAGYAASSGLAYGGALGILLAVLSLLAGVAGLLFWIVREKWQHGTMWASRQSILEWALPAAITPIAMVAGGYYLPGLF